MVEDGVAAPTPAHTVEIDNAEGVLTRAFDVHSQVVRGRCLAAVQEDAAGRRSEPSAVVCYDEAPPDCVECDVAPWFCVPEAGEGEGEGEGEREGEGEGEGEGEPPAAGADGGDDGCQCQAVGAGGPGLRGFWRLGGLVRRP